MYTLKTEHIEDAPALRALLGDESFTYALHLYNDLYRNADYLAAFSELLTLHPHGAVDIMVTAADALLAILGKPAAPVCFSWGSCPGRYWGNVLVKLPLPALNWINSVYRRVHTVRSYRVKRGAGRQQGVSLTGRWLPYSLKRVPRRCQRRQLTASLYRSCFTRRSCWSPAVTYP